MMLKDAVRSPLATAQPYHDSGLAPDSGGQKRRPCTVARVCSPSAFTNTDVPGAALAFLSIAKAIGAAPSIGLSVLEVITPISAPIDPSALRSKTCAPATG